MSKNNIIFSIICLVILLASAYFFYLSRTVNSYYAVYLKTGDLYFGHLSAFPSLAMTDVHYIQKNGTGDIIELQKFADSVFNPEDKISVNRNNVVWIVKLKESSQVVKAIKQGIAIPDQGQMQFENNKSEN